MSAASASALTIQAPQEGRGDRSLEELRSLLRSCSQLRSELQGQQQWNGRTSAFGAREEFSFDEKANEIERDLSM